MNCIPIQISDWFINFIGGYDKLFFALIVFMAANYITGIMCKVCGKPVAKNIGYIGMFQNIAIILLVGMANIIDGIITIEKDHVLRAAVLLFYLSKEGISILKHASQLGLPLPNILKKVLKILQ